MTPSHAPSPLLSVAGMTKVFGGITAVSDLSFDVAPGEIVGLVGPNGAGKTTCFNMITGFYAPTRGQVTFDGHDITGLKPHAIARRGLVRSFQKTNVMKSLTVFENVMSGHYMAARQPLLKTLFPGAGVRRTEQEMAQGAREIIQMIGLEARLNAPAQLLSCGELRLLEVAVAIAARPTLLMLDEPAAGLNSLEAENFGKVLKRLRGKYITSLLLVEHNMSLVMGISDRVIVMDFGRKLAEGAPSEILANPDVIEAYLGKAAQ